MKKGRELEKENQHEGLLCGRNLSYDLHIVYDKFIFSASIYFNKYLLSPLLCAKYHGRY